MCCVTTSWRFKMKKCQWFTRGFRYGCGKHNFPGKKRKISSITYRQLCGFSLRITQSNLTTASRKGLPTCWIMEWDVEEVCKKIIIIIILLCFKNKEEKSCDGDSMEPLRMKNRHLSCMTKKNSMTLTFLPIKAFINVAYNIGRLFST